MAKAQDRQLAECKSIRTYTDKQGELRTSYNMELDGKLFEVPKSKNFQAVEGKFYYPEVYIKEVPRQSPRTGTLYISLEQKVRWHEAN